MVQYDEPNVHTTEMALRLNTHWCAYSSAHNSIPVTYKKYTYMCAHFIRWALEHAVTYSRYAEAPLLQYSIHLHIYWHTCLFVLFSFFSRLLLNVMLTIINILAEMYCMSHRCRLSSNAFFPLLAWFIPFDVPCVVGSDDVSINHHQFISHLIIISPLLVSFFFFIFFL